MKDLLANLQKIGFSQYEARAYVSLLQNPQVTAYELARHSGIPPSKIYEVVERLLTKELVTTLGLEKHPKYVALDPARAVDRYRRSYRQVLDAVAAQLEGLYSGTKGGDAYVWNLVDREDIESKAVQLVESAQDAILMAAWPSELKALEQYLAAAHERGVSVSICLYGEGDPGFGVVYNHDTSPEVLSNQGTRRMVLVVDHEEALIAYFPEVGQVTAVRSANRGFVQMAHDYIRHDIWIIEALRNDGREAASAEPKRPGPEENAAQQKDESSEEVEEVVG
jgi:HTH-type transcriptional regulator, sugar sensing transcriptional regulator